MKNVRPAYRSISSSLSKIKYIAGYVVHEAGQYTAHQYSSARVRNNRRSYILYKQMPLPEHKESIKRYSQILSKKKQKQGGLDSFWMFKKEATTE